MFSASQQPSELLRGQRVAIVGKLASMTKRDAQQLIKQHGGVPADRVDGGLNLLVVGEYELPLEAGDGQVLLPDDAARSAAEQGELEVLTETQFWQRLGLVDDEPNIHRLYTTAMLAGLLKIDVSIVRRWQRKGLIRPACEVRKLAYFDFREIATARRLAELLSSGVSPTSIERQLSALGRWLPGVERPLAQLSVMVQGKELLLRQGDGLVDSAGQFRIDFDSSSESNEVSESNRRPRTLLLPAPRDGENHPSPEEILQLAAQLEDEGQLTLAVEMYRAALAAAGPTPGGCFQLAELLYRIGEPVAAIERYYMAIELDEDFVEARSNLGCVLAETNRAELAIAAFEGALAYHPEYADAHYHLARTLDELQRPEEAEQHWRAFVELAPDSPWSAEARERLERVDS